MNPQRDRTELMIQPNSQIFHPEFCFCTADPTTAVLRQKDLCKILPMLECSTHSSDQLYLLFLLVVARSEEEECTEHVNIVNTVNTSYNILVMYKDNRTNSTITILVYLKRKTFMFFLTESDASYSNA